MLTFPALLSLTACGSKNDDFKPSGPIASTVGDQQMTMGAKVEFINLEFRQRAMLKVATDFHPSPAAHNTSNSKATSGAPTE